MKKEIMITYEWWNNECAEVKESHQEALEEDAMERINEMTKEGFTSGDLVSNVRVDDNDGEDGVEYIGYWSLNTKTL